MCNCAILDVTVKKILITAFLKKLPFLAKGLIERIPDNVVHFGQLATNNEWHIVLKTEEANNKLLSAGQLYVKGVVF